MGDAVKDNEALYDEQIAPLMKQIIAICKEHGVPMFATFVYAPDQFCTTTIPGPPGDEATKRMTVALGIVRDGFAAFAVRTRP